MSDVFVSYSREDQAIAMRIAEGLRHAGFTVWWDQALNAGEAYDEVTEKALEEARAVIVLWSRSSVTSRWVRAEATTADRLGTLVPVMLEECRRPIMFELRQCADLSQWNGDGGDPSWQGLVASVRRLVQPTEPGLPQAAPATPPAPTPAPASRPNRIGILAVGAAALLAAAAGLLLLRDRNASRERPAPSASAEVSLAVLPFANLSADPDQEYFSDGLTEEILNQLAQVPGLRLIGRTSSFSFKGKNEDLREIGRKLGTDNLLEGSVRRDGDQLRITAQLINAADGSHRWSKTYPRELKDMFAVQEEISREVAQALSIKLDVGEMSRSRGGTNNLQAFDLYLRGRQIKAKGLNQFGNALANLREAVRIDPDFVAAWRELHDTLGGIQVSSAQRNEELAQEQARAISQIEKLAPDAWQTHAMRASRLTSQKLWLEAEAEANLALASAPLSQLGTASFYASLMYILGRPSAVTPIAERHARDDPLSILASNLLQNNYFFSGRFADASREFQRGIKLDGDKGQLFGREVTRLLALPEAHSPAGIAELKSRLAPGGLPPAIKQLDQDAALKLIRGVVEDPAIKASNGLMQLAQWADYFGDKDLALEALRRGVDLQAPLLGYIWLPFHTGLRADPRFKDILRDLKIADYYRATGKWGEFCRPVGDTDFECR